VAWQPFHQNKKTPIRIDRDGTRTQRILNTIRYGGDGEDKLGHLEEGGSIGDIVAEPDQQPLLPLPKLKPPPPPPSFL
jgi:hypothetical protein